MKYCLNQPSYSITFGTIKKSSFFSGEFFSISFLIFPSSTISFLASRVLSVIDLSVLIEKEIFDVIQEESQKRVSFYDIINDINKNLDKKEKIDILRMLWEIAYADKVLDVDEERIIRRSAEMLGIKPSIVLQTKEEFKNQ